jgi:hypothetical protein
VKHLLALSLLVAVVVVPAAAGAAAETVNVATASAVAPGADPITVTRMFTKLPREMYIVTSGPVGSVSAKVSCRPSVNSSWPKVNRAYDSRPGRLGLSYDHDSYSCSVTGTATAAYRKAGTIKIALQIVR